MGERATARKKSVQNLLYVHQVFQWFVAAVSFLQCISLHTQRYKQLNTTKLSVAWITFFDALWWWLKSSGFFLVWSVHSRANVAFNMNMDMRIDFHSSIHYFRMHLTLSHFNKYFLHLLNSSHNNSGSNVRKCFNVILFCIVVWRLTLDVGCCSTYIHKYDIIFLLFLFCIIIVKNSSGHVLVGLF